MSIYDRTYMSGYGKGFQWNLTLKIIALNAICFLIQSIIERTSGTAFLQKYIYLSREGLSHAFVWQLLTFQFMHSGFFHLLFNSLGIFFIGRAIEKQLSPEKYLFMYLFAGIIGGILQIGLTFLLPGMNGYVVGASAGLFGLLAAFGLILGHEIITMLLFFILPISFPGRLLIPLGIIISVLGIFGDGSNVAHGAHLGGMLGALFYLKYLQDKIQAAGFQSFIPRKPKGNIIKGTNFKGRSKQRIVDAKNSKSKSSAKSKSQPSDEEINQILDKINEKGIHSITDEERRKLENAGNILNKKK